MFTLELTQEEQMILTNILERCVSDLHSEIIRTDKWEYKEMLKRRKKVLQDLLDTIRNLEQQTA